MFVANVWSSHEETRREWGLQRGKMVLESAMGTATKAGINFLSHFVIVNMFIALREDSMHHPQSHDEYDFVVSKFGALEFLEPWNMYFS